MLLCCVISVLIWQNIQKTCNEVQKDNENFCCTKGKMNEKKTNIDKRVSDLAFW